MFSLMPDAFESLLACSDSTAPKSTSGYKVKVTLWGVYLISFPGMILFSNNYPVALRDVMDLKKVCGGGQINLKES
jgi:hypothetical protein